MQNTYREAWRDRGDCRSAGKLGAEKRRGDTALPSHLAVQVWFLKPCSCSIDKKGKNKTAWRREVLRWNNTIKSLVTLQMINNRTTQRRREKKQAEWLLKTILGSQDSGQREFREEWNHGFRVLFPRGMVYRFKNHFLEFKLWANNLTYIGSQVSLCQRREWRLRRC